MQIYGENGVTFSILVLKKLATFSIDYFKLREVTTL